MAAPTYRWQVRVLGWSVIASAIYALMELCALALLWSQGFGSERAMRLASLISRLDERQRGIVRAALEGEAQPTSLHDELGWVSPMRSPTTVSGQGQLIAAFGDSFTYGAEVDADEAWPFLLDEQLPDAEVLNLGVPGYGLDQAYLRYRLDGERLQPDIVLMGFILEDAERNTTPFRPFAFARTSVPLGKPRFVLEGDKLTLLPNPLRRHDYYALLDAGCTGEAAAVSEACPPAPPLALRLPSVQLLLLLSDRTSLLHVSATERATRFDLTARIFLEFSRDVLRNGSIPIALLMPRRYELNTPAFAAYEAYFTQHGIRFIDVTPALRWIADVDSLFRPGGHYSPRANRIVANVIRRYLQRDVSIIGDVGPSGPR